MKAYSSTQTIRENITRHGYAFIREYYPGRDAVSVANEIGKPVAPWQGKLVQNLIPKSSATPNTYSGIYGLGSFPFHTDLAHWRKPPRYILLRCVTGYTEVQTLLLDGHTIFDMISLDVLTRAIYKPRRPRAGGLALLRLCEPYDGGYCLRWDEIFLKPASKIGNHASERMRSVLPTCKSLSIGLVQSGDTLLIDNWRMLHSRSPIPLKCESRKIQRTYLESLY